MQDSTSENLDYCKNLIKTQDYARFLQCAFAPETIPYYALEAELRHIHDHVSEEMIGHIRYAWWFEAVEALAGDKPRQHPVLVALAESGIDNALLLGLVESYREVYPQLPQSPPSHLPPQAGGEVFKKWHKAGKIIAAHGTKPRWRLLVKLLFV